MYNQKRVRNFLRITQLINIGVGLPPNSLVFLFSFSSIAIFSFHYSWFRNESTGASLVAQWLSSLCSASAAQVHRPRSWVETYTTHQPCFGSDPHIKQRKIGTDISSELIFLKQKKDNVVPLATDVSCSGLIFLRKKKKENQTQNYCIIQKEPNSLNTVNILICRQRMNLKAFKKFVQAQQPGYLIKSQECQIYKYYSPLKALF